MSTINKGQSGSKQPATDDKHGPLRNEAAVEMIRERIKQLHTGNHPDKKGSNKPSLLEQFKTEHKDHPDKQAAWEAFYNRLDEEEKQQLWDEYHDISAKQSEAHDSAGTDHISNTKHANEYATFAIPGQKQHDTKKPGVIHPTPRKDPPPEQKNTQSVADVKSKLLAKVRQPAKSNGFWARNGKALIMAGLVMFILLFANYNQLFIAQVKQFISPGNSLNSPIIVDPNAEVAIGDEARIIIPKINVDVPVVYDIKTYDENAIQAGLERGVVHYNNTSVPGKAGNNVIVGHSSNNFFNTGKYKFAFVLLDRLEVGDTFILHYGGVRYIYKVSNKKVISPNDFSLIQPTATPTTTLITCTPPGTSWNRLVVQGEQISPSPTKAKPDANAIQPEDVNSVVPGNSPSLLDKIFGWFRDLFGNN